jgi:YHS domain-containing protein
MVRDPVCGMLVDEKNPPAKTKYKNKDYYFCMEGCKREFEKNPENYTKEEVKDT